MAADSLPSELLMLIQRALEDPTVLSISTTSARITENGGASSRGSKSFQELIKGIHFSKTFILSYQLVLIALLVGFTLIHWTSRFLRWRRKRERSARERPHSTAQRLAYHDLEVKRRMNSDSRSNASSSSSSTLRVDAALQSALLDGPHERTSLLLKPILDQNPRRQVSLANRIKGWLVYQPRPIPVIGKKPPSNGASLAILAFTGLQLFYTFFKIPLSLSTLFVFADRTSLLFVANLPLLYLFAAKSQPLKFLTGYSYESLNIFHRRLGEVMCLLALFHSLGMIGVWYTILRPSGVTLVKFLLIKMILLGVGAFAAYEMIYFTSLGSFRQKWYELFLGVHVVLQAAALILVWFHHHGSRPYVGVALATFLIDRLVYRLLIKSSYVLASLDVKKDGKTVSVRTSLPSGPKRSFVSYLCGTSNINRGWKATEHVFLTVPSLAHKHVIQAHPFTIASKAPTSDDEEINLKLLIRAQDGFSADLLRYAKSHNTAIVKLDGPYGSQSAVRMLQDSDHAIIVAGGSGIAVALPLVHAVLETFDKRDLEHANPDCKTRLILFVWIIREQSHLSWLDGYELEGLKARGVNVEIPPPTAKDGHPDIESLIENWTTALEGRVGVVASGPDGLNRSVRNTCSSLIGKGQDVHVEIEKFGW